MIYRFSTLKLGSDDRDFTSYIAIAGAGMLTSDTDVRAART